MIIKILSLIGIFICSFLIISDTYKIYALIILIICSIYFGRGDKGKDKLGETPPTQNDEFDRQNNL
jgi:hypothetical protein